MATTATEAGVTAVGEAQCVRPGESDENEDAAETEGEKAAGENEATALDRRTDDENHEQPSLLGFARYMWLRYRSTLRFVVSTQHATYRRAAAAEQHSYSDA